MDLQAILLKIGAKAALNICLPGSGSVVDLLEAGNDLRNGDYLNAALNVCSGVYDFCTLGLYGVAKEAAKGSAKQASIKLAKEACKESKKKIGEETAKMIAQGVPKKVAVELSKLSAKQAEKEIGSRLSKELASGLLHDVTEEAFKQPSLCVGLKKVGLSFLGSGLKEDQLPKAMIIGSVETLRTGYKNHCSAAASRKLLTYSFGKAATSAAKSTANTYYKDALKGDLIVNAVKGNTKYCHSKPDSVVEGLEWMTSTPVTSLA